MVRHLRNAAVRHFVAFTLGTGLVLGAGLHALAKAISTRPEVPTLEGRWSAQVFEPGPNGLVEEVRTFEIAFDDAQRFRSRTLAGEQSEGTYQLARGRLLRLSGERGEEVYSLLPLSEQVLAIYREGSQKAIYLVRN